MLKGYIKCTEIRKLLLRYIHFDLRKKEMEQVAIHLRNCPICMEKYSILQKREKSLKNKMYKIEKTLRMQDEISSYMDNECNENQKFIIEGKLLTDKKYKKELIECETTRRILSESRKRIKENRLTFLADKIIEDIKNKKFYSGNFILQFQQKLRGFLKY